jgi:cytochrome c553
MQQKSNKELAVTYCSSCHVFPEPSLLPKNIWIKKVLPNMATRMGIPREYPYAKLPYDDVQAVMKAQVIPSVPTLSEEDMLKIVQYYTENAPEKPLPQKRKIEPNTDFNLFKIRTVSNKELGDQNILLKKQKEKILLSFEDKGTFSFDLKQKKVEKINSSISVDYKTWGIGNYMLDLTTIEAHNLPKDYLIAYPSTNQKIINKPKIILDSLIRPVSFDVADINYDQKPDFVISEFGDYIGELSLFRSNVDGYKKETLKKTPGACNSYFKDLNNDGKLEIIALMSQGKEEIVIFEKVKDKYIEKIIAAFPSCFGSNSMEIADLDKDGLLDIIVTNGDNADASSSLKNYHGVRIYKNLGNLTFKEVWFYPVHGASGLTIDDFDKDGDNDILIISHFPDFSKEQEENLIYFKNNGYFDFAPSKPINSLNGRPLTLAKTDYDNDGDVDVIIGNHVDNLTDPGYTKTKKWEKDKITFWILENTTKR